MVINIINLSPDQEIKRMDITVKKDFIRHGREERVLSIVKQSKEFGFAVRFWEGITDQKPFIGINRAFKQVVRWAKEQNLPSVCIGEDDLIFTAPGAWQYYLDNMPEDFDTYLGGIYNGGISDGRIISGYSGHTLITVHQRFYDFFLSVTDLDHLDRKLGSFAHEKIYRVCEPFVVIQSDGFSDNHQRMSTHAAKLSEMKLFGRS